MWKRLIMALVMLLYCTACDASPLQDFSPGKVALDVNWKPNSFRGGDDKWEYSGTVGLGDRWALNYRQINFRPKYNKSPIDSDNKEVNVLYKINDNIQLMAGYSMTKRHGLPNRSLPEDNMVQGGVIASTSLGPSTTAFTLLSFGSKGDNIEVGLSYQVAKDVELTATYRHIEYKSGGGQADFRGFGLGFTFKN